MKHLIGISLFLIIVCSIVGIIKNNEQKKINYYFITLSTRDRRLESFERRFVVSSQGNPQDISKYVDSYFIPNLKEGKDGFEKDDRDWVLWDLKRI